MKIGIIGSGIVGRVLATAFISEGEEVMLGTRNISKEEVDDIKGVFEAFDMNGDISELSADDIVKTTKSDKKMVGDKIKFVLLRSVGDAYIDMSVTDDEMKQVLQG